MIAEGVRIRIFRSPYADSAIYYLACVPNNPDKWHVFYGQLLNMVEALRCKIKCTSAKEDKWYTDTSFLFSLALNKNGQLSLNVTCGTYKNSKKIIKIYKVT